ncbi:MAG TPA: hypothetical protein VJ772_09025 [Nitrososphaeraceae archaeon]|nr:hypothetical protein [Nitrososphaeraceae archaeon]
MMVSLETSVSLASLGLIIMFVVLMYSFISNILIGQESQGPDIVVQPEGVLIQVVSISAAPGIILAGITFGLVRYYGSRKIGIILCISGIVLIIGNILILNLVPRIPQFLFVPGIIPLTYGLLAAGVGVVILGIIVMMREGKIKRPFGEEDL